MKLAVKKDHGSIPGGGFHYMLHPMKLEPEEMQAAVFELMGYHIIDVDEPTGERLIASARAALNHQIEVATLTERALSRGASTK